MGIYRDCKTVVHDKPPSALTALEREVLYARIRAFSVRVQYVIWNIAATAVVYLFNGSMMNGYLWNGHFYKVFIFHSIQLLSIIAYFATSLSNPGHVPLLSDDEYSLFEHDRADDHHGHIPSSDDDQEQHDEDVSIEPWNKNIMVDPNNAPFNFCWRCKMVRPIRSKHCYDCDRCIGKFDHHCPMVGNCVGGKNHRFFVVFLCTQSIVVMWCFQLSLTDLYYKYHNIILRQYPTSAVGDNNFTLGVVLRLMFFMGIFFSLLIVVGLCGFHVYLSSTNQTTYEMVKPHMLEKWVKEEKKRKKKYLKNHAPPSPPQQAYAQVNVDNEVERAAHAHPRHEEYRQVQVHDHGQQEQEQQQELLNISNDADVDDDTENIDDIDDSHYRSTRHNNMISFDEGTCRNLYAFWTGTLKKPWITAYSCVLMDEEDDRSD